MAKSVIINGVSYADVPSVQIPLSATPSSNATFYEVSDATASQSHILTGKTAYISSGKKSGSMANNGATGGHISTIDGTVTIPAGYTSGGTVDCTITNNGDVSDEIDAVADSITIPAGYTTGGTVAIKATEQAKIITGNIKSGVTILGVAGKSTVVDTSVGISSGESATAGEILTGKKGYNSSGTLVTGTMANNGSTSGTISTKAGTVNIPAGYTTGGTVSISSTEQAKIIAGNIKSGVTILGVAGSATIIDVSATTAVAADVVTGKKFYASDGTFTTGSLTLVSVSQNSSTKVLTIS